jgi:hypothetical protein
MHLLIFRQNKRQNKENKSNKFITCRLRRKRIFGGKIAIYYSQDEQK